MIIDRKLVEYLIAGVIVKDSEAIGNAELYESIGKDEADLKGMVIADTPTKRYVIVEINVCEGVFKINVENLNGDNVDE